MTKYNPHFKHIYTYIMHILYSIFTYICSLSILMSFYVNAFRWQEIVVYTNTRN